MSVSWPWLCAWCSHVDSTELAEGHVSSCSEFLATCPVGEEHKAWLLEAKEKLVKPMEMLLSFDAKDLVVARALCLKLLALERTDWYGSTQERYPDGATIAALEILRRVASKGDAEVVRVLKFWLKKVYYKDFGTDECTDSVKTVFHAVKAVPDLVEAGDTEVLEILKHHTDACAMIEGLCVAADLREADLPEGSRGHSASCLRNGASLSARSTATAPGDYRPESVRSGKTRKLVFTSDAVAAFEARRPETIERARAFNRMDSEDRARALARVAELQEQGQSPNAAARAAAEEMGRSHETIRQLLAQGSAAQRAGPRGSAASPYARTTGSSSRRTQPNGWGATRCATRRTIDAARLERLRNLELHWHRP